MFINLISSKYLNYYFFRDCFYLFFNNNKEEEDSHTDDDNPPIGKITIGGELCELLMNLFIAHNYATSKKNCKQSEDKIVIVAAFTNLLYVSKAAKQTALEEVNLPETALMILKELYVQLNLQPFEIYKKQAEKKVRNRSFLGRH